MQPEEPWQRRWAFLYNLIRPRTSEIASPSDGPSPIRGVDGNEQADARARRAAEKREGRADPEYLREASLSHLTRVSTERRATETGRWIREHVGEGHRYRPPPQGERCARSWAGYERSGQEGFTSFSRDIRPRPPSFSVLASPPVTDAGGAVRESDRRATISSSGADAGPPRSAGFGRASRGSAAPGPPQSVSSSETRAQRWRFWIF